LWVSLLVWKWKFQNFQKQIWILRIYKVLNFKQLLNFEFWKTVKFWILRIVKILNFEKLLNFEFLKTVIFWTWMTPKMRHFHENFRNNSMSIISTHSHSLFRIYFRSIFVLKKYFFSCFVLEMSFVSSELLNWLRT